MNEAPTKAESKTATNAAPAMAGARQPPTERRWLRPVDRILGKNGPWIKEVVWTGGTGMLFLALCAGFFLLLGKHPLELLWQVALGAFGDKYSTSETLVKTTPILFCALAAAVPARLGLLSVGQSGQFYLGAFVGTFFVLHLPAATPAYLGLPSMLLFAGLGGAAWGVVPGFLRARVGVNETLTTLLFNYVGALLVDWAVYGPWRDPNNLGWPASAPFPAGAIFPGYFGSRLHAGLFIAIALAVGLHILLTRTRWGLMLRVMKSNRKVAESAGMRYGLHVVAVMAIGGALAGLAGICETSAIQGRLQSGVAANYGITGFLVAWMAGQHLIRILPLALVMGAILSASDALQLFAELPSAIAVVMQAMLFLSVLGVAGWRKRKGG
ncbi:MAG: ABC transporter permease [Fibrobacteria bacterium]